MLRFFSYICIKIVCYFFFGQFSTTHTLSNPVFYWAGFSNAFICTVFIIMTFYAMPPVIESIYYAHNEIMFNAEQIRFIFDCNIFWLDKSKTTWLFVFILFLRQISLGCQFWNNSEKRFFILQAEIRNSLKRSHICNIWWMSLWMFLY